MDVDNESMYAKGPILSINSNGPQYITSNFGKLPNFNEILFAIYISNFGPIIALSIGLSQLTDMLHFLPHKASNKLIINYS